MAFDEMGQSSSEIIDMFDIIRRKIRNSNIYMGGVMIIFLLIILRYSQLRVIHL